MAFGLRFGRFAFEAGLRRRRQERVEHTVFGGILGAVAVFAHGLFAQILQGDFHQIAHNAVDVTPHIAHFGELGGLDFDKRRIGQPRQTAGNFGFAHAGGADHQDIFRHDFALQRLGHLASAVAVAQGYGHSLFGLLLADDVFVQLVDDFLRCHHGSAHKTAPK